MSLIPITKELIDVLEEFRKSFGEKWLSINVSQRVFRAQRIPFVSYEQLMKMGLQKAQVLNKLASIFNRYWKDFIEDTYGEKIDLYKILQDIIGDEARNETRAVEQWFRGSITTQEFAEYVAQELQRRLEKEIEVAIGRFKQVY
ncbi:MAG: hypothetical protein LM583_02140 [Desulfurococcaceae archaeon]|nr:hypothetical protein [Desulfurococcaceae archaeon]